MNNTQAIKELSNGFYKIFKEYEDTNKYKNLHDEKFIDKELKEHFGKEKFKQLCTFDKYIWNQAWREYDNMRVINGDVDSYK